MSTSQSRVQLKVQRLGAFLSGMVMPNIGVFIAWGFITALFIPTGWYPNENLAKLVGPIITYLLPVLIAYTGGFAIHGRRGGVIGALATMGVVVGASVTMLIGGMIMGPLAALVMKKVDRFFAGRVKPGLEMLIDNFSLGIVGAIIMIIGYVAVEPIFSVILGVLAAGVKWVLAMGLIPLASIFVAPAQVLFLNNAVNHGIMVPLGIQEVVEHGRSILFLVEANCGPLVGVMVAFSLFGRGVAKTTAPAAAFIVLIGGIAEVYIPYVLMKPKLVIATIFGSMTSLFIFQYFDSGAVAAPAPGSLLALLMMTPKGFFTVNVIGYFAGLAVSAVIASIMLKLDRTPEEVVEVTASKEESTTANAATVDGTEVITNRAIKSVLVACDAGMGSSAMGASVLRAALKKAMLDVTVENASVTNIPTHVDLIITHANLLNRAKENCNNPDAQFMAIHNFIEAKQFARIVEHIKNNS